MKINIPPAVYVGNTSHEDEITLPPNYDLLRTRFFGADLSLVMGADGSKGLPRVITDAIGYLRTEGIQQQAMLTQVWQQKVSFGFHLCRVSYSTQLRHTTEAIL
jgi:hypothetical protein